MKDTNYERCYKPKLMLITIYLFRLITPLTPLELPPSIHPTKTSYAECGGILFNTNALIDYKSSVAYEPNERCVWTFINSYYTSLFFNLTLAGFVDDGDFLEIYYIHPGAHDLESSTCQMSQAGEACHLVTDMAFLVFKTNGYDYLEGTGFTLSILREGKYYIPTNLYDAFIDERSQGFINHKQWLATYLEFSWISWTINTKILDSTELVLHQFNISKPSDPFCTQGKTPHITVFQTMANSPKILGRVCGAITRPQTFFSNSGEPLIILYENGPESHTYYNGTGRIQFYWNLDQPPENWDPEEPVENSVKLSNRPYLTMIIVSMVTFSIFS